MTFVPYTLSYTTGAALIPEAILVAELLIKNGSWVYTRAEVLDANLFQARTDSTLKKLYREVSSRLQTLSDGEIALLSNGSEREQKQLIWLSICRRYRLIADFAQEILVNNYRESRYQLSTNDYEAFYNKKAEWHRNLDEASVSTKNKARQVVFRIMRECGLLNSQDEIVAQTLSVQMRGLLEPLHQNRGVEMRVFPGEKY